MVSGFSRTKVCFRRTRTKEPQSPKVLTASALKEEVKQDKVENGKNDAEKETIFVSL